ncbi:hypothetical protein H671_5g14290 [Cricetulus griseus]|nr:hypothetical protein H671_5g14290 [Cricetulus griseus]
MQPGMPAPFVEDVLFVPAYKIGLFLKNQVFVETQNSYGTDLSHFCLVLPQALARTSRTVLKRYGESGQPSLVPDIRGIG